MDDACGKKCDHGSECLKLAGHDGAHDTQHGCLFYDAGSKPRVFSRLVEYMYGRGFVEAESDPDAFDRKCEELRLHDERNPQTVAGWRERE